METVNNEWPSVEDRISETHNVYTMSEFVCIWCRNSLWQKKPKMPDQAWVIGLKLHDIPQELDSITPLECRLVANAFHSWLYYWWKDMDDITKSMVLKR